MPFESVFFLALVIGSLVVFAIALVYADWATRNAPPEGAAAAAIPSSSTAKRPNTHSTTSADIHKIAA